MPWLELEVEKPLLLIEPAIGLTWVVQ